MSVVFLIGRLIFGGYFLYNAYNHFKNYKGLTGYAQMKRVPMPSLAVIVGGVLLGLGGLAVVVNRFAILGMIMLIIFLLPTTLMMHKFWTETDPNTKMNEKIAFTKNLAIIGALLMMIAIG